MTAKFPWESIRLAFVPYGSPAELTVEPLDRLYLDVGNALGPGVIDTHHLAAHSGSTTGILWRHPELVAQSVRPDRKPDDPFTIVLHEWPDLDCAAAAFMAISYLRDGQWPEGAKQLAYYVDLVDEGKVGLHQDNPYSLYAAYMLMMHDDAPETVSGSAERWEAVVRKGWRLIRFVLDQTLAKRASILDVDAFECPGLFRKRDRAEIDNDLQRYRRHFNDPDKHVRRLRLQLPAYFGGTKEVTALLARDVQNVGDPQRCIYFKDWARTDSHHADGEEGFAALSVYMSESESHVRRGILSVTPQSGVSLQGLAERLERRETEKRVAKTGIDDRLVDPATGEPKTPRPGFANADPWYDGRGHQYTIVDSPRGGTLLSADEIEDELIEFGSGNLQEPGGWEIPAPAAESTSGSLNEDLMRRLTFLVNSWNPQNTPGHRKPEVFISYSRKILPWVEDHLYAPLSSRLGSDAVFFDKHNLAAGMSWLDELAWAVCNCGICIPVYSQSYFQSEFCQWELQLAVLRDPTGKKRVVMPVMFEETPLPAYCALIQAIPVAGDDRWRQQLMQAVGEKIRAASPDNHAS